MKLIKLAGIGLALSCLPLSAAHAQNAKSQNPEDQELADVDNAPVVTPPASPPTSDATPPKPDGPAPEVKQNTPTGAAESITRDSATTASTASAAPPDNAGGIPDSAGGTIAIPRAEWDAMRAQQAEMQRQIDELKKLVGKSASGASPITPEASPAPTPDDTVPPPVDATDQTNAGSPADAGSAPVSTNGNRNYLLLPDISFIGQAKGLLSSDKRDPDRGSLRLSEGELGIQSYVYPNVKADAFITGAPAEDEPFQLEEGYLTFLNFRKGLNINVGRRFTPFGRTGQLHNHSWLYARQLIPFRNLVSEEALTGDGVNFSYLLPTPGKLFAQLDLGIWNGEGAGEISSNPFGADLPSGPGAGFYDRFHTARLWMGHPVGENGELELGASHAKGRSAVDDDTGTRLATGRNTLTGLDISYRHFMNHNRRLLLRSEYYRSSPDRNLQAGLNRASGYYGLANLRLDAYHDIGLLYENSGFPQMAGVREKAMSLIFTKQFTEQFYVRLQGTHGDSPGKGGYNQAILQFVWGVGPHTHNLE